MLVTLDVSYDSSFAYAAAIVFQDWSSSDPVAIHKVKTKIESYYIPGKLYLRELPALKAVLQKVTHDISVIIIDGYVRFSEDSPALGWYLFHGLKSKLPVVGVAKSKFRSAVKGIAVKRGDSEKPVYVTSIGLPEEEAAANIKMMHGEFRIPTMIRLADFESRTY